MNIPNRIKCSLAFAGGLLVYLFLTTTAFSQNYFFYHLDKKDGLYDGTIRAFAQDKFGYIWIGTISGLYRYNSCGITAFLPELNDSCSAPATMTTSMVSDITGDMWIGTTNGLYRFNYKTGKFSVVQNTENIYINGLKTGSSRYVLAFTDRGLLLVDTYNNQLIPTNKKDHSGLLNNSITDGIVHKKMLYLASDVGIICFNIQTSGIEKIINIHSAYPGATFLAMDQAGTLWCTSDHNPGFLYKVNITSGAMDMINVFEHSTNNIRDQINHIFIDSKNRLWISTQQAGLILFDKEDHSFKNYQHDPLSFYSSISNDHTRKIFEDKQHNIWVGTEGHGVNYFNPDAPVFNLYVPEFDGKKNDPVWCRTVIIDSEGSTWIGTLKGIEIFNLFTGEVKHIQNTIANTKILHSNSIRSMICDNNGDIWIGTSAGINCFRKKSKKIDFYTQQDSLPCSFYWSILQDQHQRIWFGSRDGMFYKESNNPQIYSLSSIPSLRKYRGWGIRSMFEDRKKNLWFGLNGKGLLFYNPQADTAHWFKKESNNLHSIVGNMVTSIAEDKDGLIWLSTTSGISGFDYNTGQFISFNHRNGLRSIKTSCLQVDNKNRLWIGTTAGIYILEPDRKTFSIYNTRNGLPDVEFNDQSSFKWDFNAFLYPTLEGFVSFNPDKFIPDTNNLDFYLSSFKVHGKPKQLNEAIEEIKKINLTSNENFFEIEMASINYKNPDQVWYAYKLDGLHTDWIYSQNRHVNFTNIKGGEYTFRYKASNDLNNWNVPEKKVIILISTVWYKQPFFIVLLAGCIIIITFYIIKLRFKKQAHILQLENKSKLLEKEMAIAQYENLKQQLNPHLLFNTISSINSYIKIDPGKANEYLESMSKIYRYILKSNHNESVLISDELDFVENYIKLQNIRFGNGLNIIIHISITARNRKIVPVTLQNLIENAIKHNIVDEATPLNVEIYDEGDYLVVRNNLQKKNLVETSNRQGLNNLILLYKFFSIMNILILEENQYFTIKIPLL
jgi:ligand-binding sensor domain-containing protein